MSDETTNPVLLRACEDFDLTVDQIEFSTESTVCSKCIFRKQVCRSMPCAKSTRKDGKNGVWKLKRSAPEDTPALKQSRSTLSKVTRADLEDTHKLRDAMHDSPYLAALVEIEADYPSIVESLVRRIPVELR
jgi:hypothetical protein